MTPEESAAAAAKAADPADLTKNLKAELDRKLGGITEQLNAQTEALKAQIASLRPPPKPAPTGSFKEQFYQDEDAAVANLASSIKDEIRGEIQMSNRQAEVLTSLYRDFPELSDQTHDLTQKAVQIHKGLSKNEQASPGSYRLAVLEAAAEIGLPPKAKRKAVSEESEENDSFTLGGAPRGAASSKRKKGDLDPGTLQFAAQMGFDTSDEKVMERLKKAAARDTWNAYRPVK